eukprot:10936549-Alexandrium_andersonii.AAC.1
MGLVQSPHYAVLVQKYWSFAVCEKAFGDKLQKSLATVQSGVETPINDLTRVIKDFAVLKTNLRDGATDELSNSI